MAQNVEEKLVQRLLTSVFVVSLLFAVHGCSVAKRASRSSETDALLQAARAGNADTVRALVVSEREC